MSLTPAWRLHSARPLPLRISSLRRFVPAIVAAAGTLLIHATTIWRAVVLPDAEAGDQLSVAVLAPLATAWLIWDRRARIAALPLRPWWPALGAVALGSLAWALGEMSGINLLCQLSLVALLPAVAATVMGPAAARVLAFPLLFLLFTVDAYTQSIPLLMQITAHLGVGALQATGVPASLEGLTIIAPFGRWQVIEGCSGLDYILIYTMAATLFSAAAFASTRARIAFVAAAAVAAVLANGLRAWAIVYLATLRGGFDGGHDLIGWVAFALGFVLLFAAGFGLSRAGHGGVSVSSDPPRDTGSAAAAQAGSADLRRAMGASLAALALVAAAPAAMAALDRDARDSLGADACSVAAGEPAERDGVPVLRYRADCHGPAGAARSLDFAKSLLRDAVPGAVLVTGVRTIGIAPQGTGEERRIEAATLTTLPTAAAPTAHRLTYWYRVGPDEGGVLVSSRLGFKWHLALARFSGQGSRVTVFAELETLKCPLGCAP